MHNEETTVTTAEESNVAVMEVPAQTEKSAKKSAKKSATKSKAKSAKKNEETQAQQTVQTEETVQTESSEDSVKRHRDVAQFEKVLIYLLEQDGRKFVSIETIKKALEKSIETYRMAVYIWEMIGKAGAKIEKERDGRTVVAIKLLNRDEVRKYIKSRFPDMKIK